MSYESTVYRILIASPSDVDEEREVAARIIQDWNDLNSFTKKIVLLPVRWETHSSPTYGVRPQEAINKQIVDDCDILIGFFWTKIGTPTGEDLSGTTEEIRRVSSLGKPVMIYFSKRGKDPSLIEISQLQALQTFKEEIYKVALVENYSNIVDFRDKLSRHLEMKIRELQENEKNEKDLISFSFINHLTGEFQAKEVSIDLERYELAEDKFQELLKTEPKLKNRKYEFRSAVNSILRKKNKLPVLLGLKNNSNRILSNVVTELKIEASTNDELNIESFGTNQEYSFYHGLESYGLQKESHSIIRKLLRNDISKTSQNSWEYTTQPFNLIPDRVSAIETLLLLFPKTSMNVEFKIRLFSDNLLQPIESSCIVKIKVSKKEFSTSDIEDAISNTDDYDVPF